MGVTCFRPDVYRQQQIPSYQLSAIWPQEFRYLCKPLARRQMLKLTSCDRIGTPCKYLCGIVLINRVLVHRVVNFGMAHSRLEPRERGRVAIWYLCRLDLGY